MEGHNFSRKSEKQKKKTRCVDVVYGISLYKAFFCVYNYSVRSIAVLIVLNLMEMYLKGGGSCVLPRKILHKWVQNPAILEDFMSLWACI